MSTKLEKAYRQALKAVARDAREISGGRIAPHLREATMSHARHLARLKHSDLAPGSFLELLRSLRWRAVRVSAPWLSGGYDDPQAPVGKDKLKKLFAAAGLSGRRPPGPGRETLLYESPRYGREAQVWVTNDAGRFRVRLEGDDALKAFPEIYRKIR